MARLRIEGLCKGWDFPVLDCLDLSVEEGEFFVVVGPSGIGKTTLLRLIAGLESSRSTTGKYLVFNMPLATWLMMVFFRDAPRELEEAAYLDGFTPLRAFFRITLPLVLPGMISVGILCWIFAWNEYLFANLFVGTAVKTFTIVIPTFTHGSQTLWNLQMAFSLIAMVPPVTLFILLRRYMVRGLSLGVVKG